MEENNKWVIAAAKVAQRLHKDQKDKAGCLFLKKVAS